MLVQTDPVSKADIFSNLSDHEKPGQARNAGWTPAALVRVVLAGGVEPCLDAVATSFPGSLEVSRPEFFRLRAECNYRCLVQSVGNNINLWRIN